MQMAKPTTLGNLSAFQAHVERRARRPLDEAHLRGL
jgi:hypothetical protein